MTEAECRDKIRRLGWNGLSSLWQAIVACNTPGWPPGKAFEYLVLRMFELDELEVKYPFSVPMPNSGVAMEQIDGIVYVDNLAVLIESKDYSSGSLKTKIDISPIAKLRNQLQRRPFISIGCVFSSGAFTDSVSALIDYLGSETILLWHGEEIAYCIRERRIAEYMRTKFRNRVEYGVHDFDITMNDTYYGRR